MIDAAITILSAVLDAIGIVGVVIVVLAVVASGVCGNSARRDRE